MAVRKPRVADERSKCRETVFVERSCVRRSARERLFAFVSSRPVGSLAESVRRVSVIQAIRSRIHLTEPVRALITS